MKRPPSPLLKPWAITPQGLRLVLAVWSRGELFAAERVKALQARDGKPLENTRAAEVRDGVAIIPLEGPLFRKASAFDDISGATSYADVRKDFQRAIDDPSVRAIVLDINSPGGEVDGCNELADAIFASRGIKPIVAYVGGMGASAAYWLASAADEIVCAATATLGSIGVRTSLFDDSARDAKEGVKEIEIISSASPGKRGTPVDDEVIARAQQHVDDLADVFYAAVARNRGVDVSHVTSEMGSGDVLVGERAIAAKLADRLGSLEDLLVELQSEPTQGASAMKRTTVASVARNATTARAETPPNDPPAGSAEGEEMEGEATDMEPGAEGEEMEGEAAAECAKCEGSGEVDGAECESCGGTGKAKADAEDGDGDEDDKKKNEAEEKKEEQAAHRALARKLGLPVTASRREVLRAAQVAATPAGSVSKLVDARVKAQLEAAAKKREREEAATRARKLVASAVRGGWEGDEEDRKALVELATTKPKAASKILAPYLEASANLGRRIIASEEDRMDTTSDAGERVTRAGQIEIHRHGNAFASAAKALAAKEGIKLEAAQDRIKREQPALYDAYMAGR